MVNEKLKIIQTQIKAPKNLYNSFGKYNYRNAESICEAVKPYLDKNNCSLTISDEIVNIGERYYVKATCTLTDCKDGDSVTVSALARESVDKKGMDDSQITGATSSYARKYALNGMFLLDDTKDADSDEFKTENDERSKSKPKANPKGDNGMNMKISKAEAKEIEAIAEKINLNSTVYLASKGYTSFEDLTVAEAQVLRNKASEMESK